MTFELMHVDRFLALYDRGRAEGLKPKEACEILVENFRLRLLLGQLRASPESTTFLQDRRNELQTQRSGLQKEIDKIDEEILILRREQCRAEHPCACVRLNSDIGVNTMSDYELKKRSALMYTGLVSDILSADKLCGECDGTGVPGRKEI